MKNVKATKLIHISKIVKPNQWTNSFKEKIIVKKKLYTFVPAVRE